MLSQLDDATKDKTVDIEWLQAEFRELYSKFKENGDSNNQRKMIDSGLRECRPDAGASRRLEIHGYARHVDG